MYLKGRNIRVVRVDIHGLGADKCNYYTFYRNTLDSAFEEYTGYIKRKPATVIQRIVNRIKCT